LQLPVERLSNAAQAVREKAWNQIDADRISDQTFTETRDDRRSAMSLKTMEDLFIHGLKDIYYAEKKLVQQLPKMAKKAESAELAGAIEQHFKETQNQVTRLEKIFRLCDMEPRGKRCPGIEGLIE